MSIGKLYISEFEISEALSISPQSVKNRAEKEIWACKRSTTRGGSKRSYYRDLLPDDVKARLYDKQFAD